MRLLGKCPSCGNEDTICPFQKEGEDFGDWRKAKCSNCGTIWDNYFQLMQDEEEKGNKLIPVEVERIGYHDKEFGVELNCPRKEEIPHLGLIISILNAALITRFNLSVCFATEGGVEGVYKRCYVSLLNCYERLGLLVEEADYHQGKGLTEVLDFYEKMLCYLFEEEFSYRKRRYRRGEILRQSKDEKVNRVLEILFAVLSKARSNKFASKVMGTVNSANPFFRRYLRGLSDEEIAKFFVPPPITSY